MSQCSVNDNSIPANITPNSDSISDVLILSSTDGETTPDNDTVSKVAKLVKRQFDQDKIPTKKVDGNTKNGKVYIHFSDHTSCDKGTESLAKCEQITSLKFSAKLANKMLPKIVIDDVPNGFDDDIDTKSPLDEQRRLRKEAIRQSICDKNPAIKALVS